MHNLVLLYAFELKYFCRFLVREKVGSKFLWYEFYEPKIAKEN